MDRRANFGPELGGNGCADAPSASELRVKAAEPHDRAGEFCNIMALVRPLFIVRCPGRAERSWADRCSRLPAWCRSGSAGIGAATFLSELGIGRDSRRVAPDHITAIDNVARKLMQEGKRPAAVGFFFSLGHSTIVVLASVAIAATATAFRNRFDAFQNVGGVIGTLVSALFLLAIAAMNVVILGTVYRTFRQVKAGAPYVDEDLNIAAGGAGAAGAQRPRAHNRRVC